MTEYKLGEMEGRLANIIWDAAPLASPELVKICAGELKWAKSTTYTMLRRLCERGIFKNENALVTVVLTREGFYGGQSRQYVEDAFGGSLPRFLAAFMGGGNIGEKEAEDIKRMIDDFKTGGANGG